MDIESDFGAAPSEVRAVAGTVLAVVAAGTVIAGALTGSLTVTGGGAAMALAVM
ncbi:hypothetical protein ACQP1W_42395 [Spirillospora sp. CA-255316]